MHHRGKISKIFARQGIYIELLPATKLQKMGQTLLLQQDAISTSHGDGETNLIVCHQNFLTSLHGWSNHLLTEKSGWNYHQIWTQLAQGYCSIHFYNHNFPFVHGCDMRLSGNCWKKDSKFKGHSRINKIQHQMKLSVFYTTLKTW